MVKLTTDDVPAFGYSAHVDATSDSQRLGVSVTSDSVATIEVRITSPLPNGEHVTRCWLQPDAALEFAEMLSTAARKSFTHRMRLYVKKLLELEKKT